MLLRRSRGRGRGATQRRGSPAVVAFLIIAELCALLLAALPAGAEWHHPVDAPIIDPFRPPASRFGSGNRGLEYGTSGGEPVRPVAAGRVSFAGTVGGQRHVVVDHGDGLRSTYAFVESVAVVRGQWVDVDQLVGLAGPGFHLTARLGGVYVDPMLLMAGAEVEVRLVPASPPRHPARSSADLGSTDPAAAVLDAVGDLTLTSQLVSFATAARAWSHDDCTDDAVVVTSPAGGPPAAGRLLIQVGGLGSSSSGASIGDLDPTSLGYAADDVVSFSYAGGCTPEPFGVDAGGGSLSSTLASTDYGPGDTFQSLDVSAAYLADLIEAVAAERPGEAIDLAAHSLGGVVVRRALELLDGREAGAVPVSVAITIGSPHGGADLATAAAATSSSVGADRFLDPLLPADGAAREAISVLEIAEAGGFELPPPLPPPDGVRVVAVAGATDLIVAAEHAVWDGAVNVVVPTGITDGFDVHSDLPGLAEVQRELSLAVAGRPPRCVGLVDVLASAAQGRLISSAEDVITVVAGVARWLF